MEGTVEWMLLIEIHILSPENDRMFRFLWACHCMIPGSRSFFSVLRVLVPTGLNEVELVSCGDSFSIIYKELG